MAIPKMRSCCDILMLALALALTLTTIEGSMYDAAVTDLTAENFDSLVINSAETWLVKFYAPWCGHCKSSAPAFSKAAKKLLGVARLGVVNCDDHAALAQRFDVNGFPTLKLFKGEGRSRGPSDYNQARSSKAFVDHVKYAMPSFVARVKPSGLDAFFNDLPSLPHALLFTDKSSTSPLYKGMSARFRGKMAFGEVRKTDADADLLSKYSVHKFPTLLTFGKGDAEAETGRKFEGAMDPASLEKFFTSVVAGTDGEVEEAKTEEKVFAQPQAYSGDVMDIVGSKQYESVCDARKDGRLCGLAVLPGGLQHQLVNGLKTLAQRYQYDNMAFAVLDCAAEGGVFADWLGIDREKGGFIIMKARKRKFATLEGELDEETVGRFLDRVVGGDARFKKITTDLPEWVVEEPVKDNLDDEKNETKEESDESGQCGTEPPKDGSSCGASKEDLLCSSDTSMSSRLPPQSVTPPVKKRGRFSHPSPPVHDFTPPNPANFSLSIHRRQIPGGFAYDELDEDDSEEDPDFEADLTSFPDHIQQPPRPLLPPLRTPPQTRLDRPAAAKRPRLDVSRQHAASLNGPSASVSAPFHPEAVCPGEEDPEFEVDDLDSTDDEPDELPSTWMGEHQSLQYPPVLRLGDDSIQLDSEDDEDDPDYQVGNVDISPSNLQNAPHDTLRNQPQQPLVLRLGDDNLNFDSENEEDDPDYQIGNVDSQPITSQEPLDGTPDDPLDDTPDDTPDDPLDDAQESQESPDNDYIRFLMGLLADNGSPSNTAAPANLENAAEGNAQNEASQNAPNTMLDDDDDFDYLRESALVQDDPLEFREDLPVSRKEVAQLIFSSEEPNLRRQTRTWKSRKAAPRRHLVPICRDSSAAVAPTPLLPALPHAGVLPAAVPVNLAPCVAPTQVHPVPYAVQPYGNSPQTFCEISTPHVLQIKEQLGVYTHLLTHIHADLRKKARVEEKNRTSEKNGSGDDAAMQARKEGGSDAVVASAKTEELLRRLVENKKISSSYHDMLNSNIGKLKPFSEKMLYRDRDVWFKYESCKVSMYDLPCIDLIEGFLRDCEILSADKLPGEAMKRFEGYKRMDVGQALQRKQQQRQFTLVRAQKGWFAWSVEDDTLLAMTIGKYGRDFGSGWKDLLPHRVGDDCRARVRYLASRRCGDNAVKRQVMHVSTRLTKEELKLVQIGLMRFGGNVEDGEMWKCIQRDFLPNREWSHLQKLWLWRETRRKYKVKYRAKAVEKKKAALLRGGATQA